MKRELIYWLLWRPDCCPGLYQLTIELRDGVLAELVLERVVPSEEGPWPQHLRYELNEDILGEVYESVQIENHVHKGVDAANVIIDEVAMILDESVLIAEHAVEEHEED